MSSPVPLRIWITSGPASVAIDAVRRITNFSTGELGTRLANRLADRGHRVVCFRGVGATAPGPLPPVQTIPFFGNRDLLDLLHSTLPEPDLLFHAAALADFEPIAVWADGHRIAHGTGKIRSETKRLLIEMRPAEKVLMQLREFFPHTRIFGWKYEVAGTRDAALALGNAQIATYGIDGCIVNGPAMGSELVLLRTGCAPEVFTDRNAFLEKLPDLLAL